jgi:hypothetical protein
MAVQEWYQRSSTQRTAPLQRSAERNVAAQYRLVVQRLRCLTLNLCLTALLFLAGCRGERPPDGHIMVKNDSQDRSYNIITVSGGGAYGALKPGEKLILPSGTKNFSVERRYKDYTRSYAVSCPPLSGRGILVKLIDIHVNRIAGGCKTVHASKE